jgi:hypothetical protein
VACKPLLYFKNKTWVVVLDQGAHGDHRREERWIVTAESATQAKEQVLNDQESIRSELEVTSVQPLEL